MSGTSSNSATLQVHHLSIGPAERAVELGPGTRQVGRRRWGSLVLGKRHPVEKTRCHFRNIIESFFRNWIKKKGASIYSGLIELSLLVLKIQNLNIQKKDHLFNSLVTVKA